MHLHQISRRFEKLAQNGLEYHLGPPATAAAIDAAESRLEVRLPEQVRRFYSAFDGLEVVDPPFKLFPLSELHRDGSLLEFCRCDGIHRLAFDTSQLNPRDQWFIVNADTGYRVTFTMASFWSVRMWSWIELGRPIWFDVHGEAAQE